MNENIVTGNLKLGRKFTSKYEVLSLLGSGNFSSVYLCINKELGTKWAVKVVSKKEEFYNHLREEVDILKNINHIAIPQIVDIIEDTKYLYIVESYIEGKRLDSVLEEDISPEEIFSYIYQVAEIFNYLHNTLEYEVTYRDLKPSNIIVTYGNKIVLVDFNSAAIEDTKDKVLITNKMYSTTLNISDKKRDIYSLGTLLYRMLTFDYKEKITLNSINKNIEVEDHREFIERCIRPSKDGGYSDISEVINDLEYMKISNIKRGNIGRKVIFIDGAKSSGRSFISSGLASSLADKNVNAALLDLTYDIGVCEHFNISKDENLSMLNLESRSNKIKHIGYKASKNISIYKGEVKSEDTLIDIITKLIDTYQIIVIDGNYDLTKKLATFLDEIILVTKQDEKSKSEANKKVVGYIDKNINISQITVIVNEYEVSGRSKFEILRQLNILPKIFKIKDKFIKVFCVNEISRSNFLKLQNKHGVIYDMCPEVKSQFNTIADSLYDTNIKEKKKLKVGFF